MQNFNRQKTFPMIKKIDVINYHTKIQTAFNFAVSSHDNHLNKVHRDWKAVFEN